MQRKKYHFLLILVVNIFSTSASNIEDLQVFIKNLEKNGKPVTPELPRFPSYLSNPVIYKWVYNGNIFSTDRVNKISDIPLQNFRVSQTSMVGYMLYQKIDYSFIKTPYETLKMKVGDQIANGTIKNITANTTEIDVKETADGKLYIHKVYLELDSTSNGKPPLQKLNPDSLTKQ